MLDEIRKCLSMQRICILIVAIAYFFTLFAIPANAATRDLKATASSFTKEWERSKTDGKGNAYILKLRYGYDTTAINEDYVRATASVANKPDKHQGIIKNGNGTHYGRKGGYTIESRVDVRHKGKTVTYINRKYY